MTPNEVKAVVGDTPGMGFEQGRTITAFIHAKNPATVLELGFYHGVSSCYIAAALAEIGAGRLVTIDNESALTRKPFIGDLLARCALGPLVEFWCEPTSYTWRLMRFLEEDSRPRFDLCYIDGAHTWFVDGFAFFLVDRLLRPGGWVIFDDLDWTWARSPSSRDTEGVRRMPRDERETPQVSLIYNLLVKPHPNYGKFEVSKGWAYAQKLGPEVGPIQVKREVVYTDLRSIAAKVKHRTLRLLRGVREWLARRPKRPNRAGPQM